MSGPITGDMPAFPVGVPGCGDNGWHGMSLRDWFAGQVIVGLYASDRGPPQPALDAELAYRIASAMLDARAAALKTRDSSHSQED